MSKIRIQCNASGTGVLTIEAPNTNTDRTITLPDEDITLGGGVDGIVSSANATAITIDSSERVLIESSSVNDPLRIRSPYPTGSYITYSLGANGATNGYVGSAEPLVNGSISDLALRANNALVLSSGGATERLKITSDGRGLSQFTAKAWLLMNGTGTPSVADSHNVSSITDNGTADYSANFSNTMTNGSFCVVGSAKGDTKVFTLVSQSTSYARCEIRQSTDGTKSDNSHVCLQVFGD